MENNGRAQFHKKGAMSVGVTKSELDTLQDRLTQPKEALETPRDMRSGRQSSSVVGKGRTDRLPRSNTFPLLYAGPDARVPGLLGAVPGGLSATFPGAPAPPPRPPRFTLRWERSAAGRLPGQLRTPTDVCFVDAENLLVSEARNSRLQLFDARRGRHRLCIDRRAAPDLVNPTSICPAPDGYLWLVADLNQVRRNSMSRVDSCSIITELFGKTQILW